MKFKKGDRVTLRHNGAKGVVEGVRAKTIADDREYEVRMLGIGALHLYCGSSLEPAVQDNWAVAAADATVANLSTKAWCEVLKGSGFWGDTMKNVALTAKPKTLPVGTHVWVSELGGFEGHIKSSRTDGQAYFVQCVCHPTNGGILVSAANLAVFDKFWNQKRAHKQGKTIQWSNPKAEPGDHGYDWIDLPTPSEPCWFETDEYRVKPAVIEITETKAKAAAQRLGEIIGTPTGTAKTAMGELKPGKVIFTPDSGGYPPYPMPGAACSAETNGAWNVDDEVDRFCHELGVLPGAIDRTRGMTTGLVRGTVKRFLEVAFKAGVKARMSETTREVCRITDEMVGLKREITGLRGQVNSLSVLCDKRSAAIKDLEDEVYVRDVPADIKTVSDAALVIEVAKRLDKAA